MSRRACHVIPLDQRKAELVRKSNFLREAISLDIEEIEHKAAKLSWVFKTVDFVQSRKWLVALFAIGSAWYLQRLQWRWLIGLTKRAIAGYQAARKLQGFWRG